MRKQHAYLFLFFLSASAALQAVNYQWGSVDGSGAWNGFSSGGFLSDANIAFAEEIIELPNLPDGTPVSPIAQAGIFAPTADDSLTIIGNVCIQGDIEIRFEGSPPTVDSNGNPLIEPEVFTVNIGSPVTAGSNLPVTISAYTDTATTITNGASQLVFNVAEGKVIVVNLYANLDFQSADALPSYDAGDVSSTGAPVPLYVTFRGRGSTVFRLPSGARLRFGPPNPGHTAFNTTDIDGSPIVIPADAPLSTHGVHVQVFMEQGYIDAYGNEFVGPQQQLCFEKWSYDVDTSVAPAMNTDLSLDTWITFGQLSSFSFMSDNYAGVSETWNDNLITNGLQDVAEQLFQTGYGSVSFDPSNKGTGRLILQLCPGQDPNGNDFKDAGFNIYGALLVPTVPSTTRAPAIVLNSDFRLGVYFNQRAGAKALMRVVDNVSFSERVNFASGDFFANPSGWLTRPVSDRRGLVIINHVNSIPHFTNNYEGALRIDDSLWAQWNDYEPGFILGVNGQLEVYSHNFVDYIANNFNQPISTAHANLSVYTPGLVKKHNPAALYAQTIPTFPRRSTRQTDQWGIPISDLQYVANSHPSIVLQGDAGFFVRAAAANDTEAFVKKLFLQPFTKEFYFLDQIVADDILQVITIALGIGTYDGTYIPVSDAYGNNIMQSTELDGAHALDVEGKLSVVSQEGLRGEPVAGFFTVPPVEIDYAGREVGYTNFEEWAAWISWLTNAGGQTQTVFLPVSGRAVTFDISTNIPLTQQPLNSAAALTRPLPLQSGSLSSAAYYAVYDRSTLFLNDSLLFDSVEWIHSDVTRKLPAPAVLPQPFNAALPHVVGAELAGIQDALYPPLLKLYNSTISCHESLVVTGAAITVQEYALPPAATDPSLADNTSRIVCYDRGRDYDSSGYGRILQLGSQANVASDGVTTSLMYNSGYLDVYRAAPTASLTAENIPPQNPTTIRLSMDSASDFGVTDSSEHGLHLLYLANGSQVHLGWPTLEGDSSYIPSALDGVVLAQLQMQDPANSKGFRFNPYNTGVGNLQFNGVSFGIGAGDEVDGLPPERPISGTDVDGVVYANCGGMLSLTPRTRLFVDTVIGRRKAQLPAATGMIVAPSDQLYFLPNGTIQDYDVDFTTDEDPSSEPDGSTRPLYPNYIVVGEVDSAHIFNVPELYETSEMESVK